ncbi:MAG: RpiB/LacA/LacB family sugar-phosphate isomerase [Rickettsiales bacterium]|jgi:RpiB/LacA/LacB family sugar-phosphate isomerase
MKISIASDHAGFNLKSAIIKEFENQYQIVDLGCGNDEISVDYPDFAKKVGQEIANKSADFGILVCGSGIGVSIMANRFFAVRAALCHNNETVELSRKHNNANVLCLGARMIESKTALEMVKIFLNTKFEEERHLKRVKKLSDEKLYTN